MSPDHLTQLILQYRYWILIPLTFIEGPIVAFFSGTLAAAGYFNIGLLAALFFVRDMIMDGLYYALGHFGGKTALARHLLARIGVTEGHLERVRILWVNYAGRTMFLGKLSYGISTSFIVVAGMVDMPLKKFFGWGAVVALVQYVGLLFLGYFFGQSLGGKISVILDNLQYVILGASIVLGGYFTISWYLGRRLMREGGLDESKR